MGGSAISNPSPLFDEGAALMLDHVEHALGVLSLCVFAGAGGYAVHSIAATIAPQWRRITRLAAGNIEPAFAPSAASSTPHVDSIPQRRGVEAAAAPAIQVRQ